MDSIPVGSVLLLLFVDFAIVELLSVFIGVLVARAAARPLWIGIVIGVLVPVVGPLIWMCVVVAQDTSLARASRNEERGAGLYVAAGLLGVSALLFLVAIAVPWGSMDGSIKGYSLFAESSAADTGIGLVAVVGTAAVLAGGIAAILLSTCRSRVAVLASMVGAAWLIVTVDALITFSAVDDLSRTVDGLSGGQAAAGAAAGGGLYASLVAAILAIAGAFVIAVIPAPTPVFTEWTSHTPTPGRSAVGSQSSAFPSPYPASSPSPAPPPVRDEF